MYHTVHAGGRIIASRPPDSFSKIVRRQPSPSDLAMPSLAEQLSNAGSSLIPSPVRMKMKTSFFRSGSAGVLHEDTSVTVGKTIPWSVTRLLNPSLTSFLPLFRFSRGHMLCICRSLYASSWGSVTLCKDPFFNEPIPQSRYNLMPLLSRVTGAESEPAAVDRQPHANGDL